MSAMKAGKRKLRKPPPYKAMSIGFIAVCGILLAAVPFMDGMSAGRKILLAVMLAFFIVVFSVNIRTIRKDGWDKKSDMEKAAEEAKKGPAAEVPEKRED